VEQRHCNYSAFSGYQRTPSAFSLIVCLDCGVRWRTRASYVERLPDFDAERETVTHQRAAHGVGLG
jgi:hypothetical protein